MQNSSFAIDLAKGCSSIEDVQEKSKNLFKDTLLEIFEVEMDEHLGYEKHAAAGINSVTAVMALVKKLLNKVRGGRVRNPLRPELEDKILSMISEW